MKLPDVHPCRIRHRYDSLGMILTALTESAIGQRSEERDPSTVQGRCSSNCQDALGPDRRRDCVRARFRP